MKVFVTGAGGLLGQGLLRSLFASSSAMTPVIRSGAARPRTLLTPRRGQFHEAPTTQTRMVVRMRHNGESWPRHAQCDKELRARQLLRRTTIAVGRQRTAQPL